MLVEGLALDLGQFEFLGGGLSGSVGARKGTGTPWGAAADLSEICEDGKALGISQRNVDHALVHPRAESLESGGFLAAACGSSGDKNTEVLAEESTGLPEATEVVNERLPLGAIVGVAGGDAEEEGVVLGHGVGGGKGNGGVLLWGVHLLQDFGGEGFFDSI